jgi:diguanylate cyclase (GGDEF)-like protein
LSGCMMSGRLSRLMAIDLSLDDPLSGANLNKFAAKLVFVSIILAILVSLAVLCVAFYLRLLPVPLLEAVSYSVMMAWLVGGGVAVILSLVLSDAFTSMALSRARFEEMSRRDGLTGLLNRRAFNQCFEETENEASLAIFDVDRFKGINDSFGHSVGDQVIKTIAACISETFGTTHAVSRIGGEEFAVIIRGGNFKDRFTLAELTRLRIAKLRIDMGGRVLSPTISVGVAEITAERSKNDIFQVADQALYLAKSAGRNRVYHESELSDPSVNLLRSSLLAVS